MLGYLSETFNSARALDGTNTWGGPDAESLPFGFQRGPSPPTELNYLGGLPGVYAAELAGLSLGKPGGGLIHGWFLTQSVPGRGLAREVYSANRTNEPIALEIPPTPRWRPTLPRGFTLLPSPSPDDVAQGVLRRFGDGTPFFNGGVPAITADGTGRLWGVGSTVDSNGLTFTKSDSLFSINENGYFQRESRQAHYRISPDGTIESFATTGGWANCEGWGKFCCSSGPPATMRGGWTEGGGRTSLRHHRGQPIRQQHSCDHHSREDWLG